MLLPGCCNAQKTADSIADYQEYSSESRHAAHTAPPVVQGQQHMIGLGLHTASLLIVYMQVRTCLDCR